MRKPPEKLARWTSRAVCFVLAFGLYWLSSFVLQARNATTHFGADAHVYTLLADGIVVDGLARFHPVTIAMAMGWMKILSPLTPWVAPRHILKAMFAAVGAAGVLAAMSAFAANMPRRYAALFSSIYAVSLGVWYFSSIEESKIVTTSLTAFYIATYLHLRQGWTTRGALLLTAILLLACLNEIVCCFLVIIPAIDLLAQRGWSLRSNWWIAAHGLAAPAAFIFLEGVVNGWLVAAGTDPDRASHLSMLIHFVSNNDFSAERFYAFAIEWLFFSIVAPKSDATFGAAPQLDFSGTFEPALTNYFTSPASAGLVALAGVMIIASVLPRYRPASPQNSAGILLGLAAYAFLRAAFFLVFNSREPLLNSSAATLPHLLILGIPFAASRFQAKRGLLLVFAVLLFITNGALILGR